MRKFWIGTFVIISISFLLIHTSCGEDQYKRLSPSVIRDGKLNILLYVFTDKSPDSFAEMLIVNSKGRKTGSDTIRSYNEISESSYVRSSGVEGNEFYDLAMTLID
jgi:hypothetical protein